MDRTCLLNKSHLVTIHHTCTVSFKAEKPTCSANPFNHRLFRFSFHELTSTCAHQFYVLFFHQTLISLVTHVWYTKLVTRQLF